MSLAQITGLPIIPVKGYSITVPKAPFPDPPTIPVVDPFAGWMPHPNNPPGAPDPYFFKGQELKKKSELLASLQK
jgi:hypothetical protein